MKLLIVTFLGALTVLWAGWLKSPESSKASAPMLESTAFSQIAPQIGKVPMMLEFGSDKCMSCQQMGQLLYKIKQKHPEAMIYFVDIYQDMPAARKFGIRMIPTQKFLDKEGQVIDTHIGLLKQEIVEKKLHSMGVL